LREIAEYIAPDKPLPAEQLLQEAVLQTRQLGRFPNLGRRVPEIPRSAHRQPWVPPCWIYYRMATHDDRVIILHVRRAGRPLRIEDIAIE
jgi:plasmid stabilization system protein ParE